jgi:hypothetical protein
MHLFFHREPQIVKNMEYLSRKYKSNGDGQ